MILNDDIHKYDNLENVKLHPFKEWLKRPFIWLDYLLFEPTYKELWQKQNMEIDRLRTRIIIMQRNEKKYLKKVRALEKKMKEREIEIL